MNTEVINLLASAIDEAIIRSGKSIREIVNIITTSHPEIAYSGEEWGHLNEQTKAAIAERVRRTLEAIR